MRHLQKTPCTDENVSVGFEYKSTNNNLEFGGVNVFASEAGLAQLKLGYSLLQRQRCSQYRRIQADVFVGPGNGFTSHSGGPAFGTIRVASSPEYIYSRFLYEQAANFGSDDRWQVTFRGTGQLSSARLLPSETLGFGGFDSVRGYDQRTGSGDHGWLTTLEIGPRPQNICIKGRSGRIRYYSFLDAGQSLIEDPLPGENGDLFLYSTGVGMQMSLGQDLSLHLDYGYGFENVAGLPNDRLHLGVIWQFSPRPE